METHLQPTDGPDRVTQALTKRWADLCREDPVAFSDAVRHADQLQRDGLGRDQAMRQVLDS